MALTSDRGIEVQDVSIAGYAQNIMLRTYRPVSAPEAMPVVLYFHGGAFTRGSLDEADATARHIAGRTPAWVVSVNYSLAPAFPFPAAPEDGYLALRWAIRHAREAHADAKRIAIAGHDAGGNIATAVAAMARDRGDKGVAAQVLLAPLLDPSLTRIAAERDVQTHDVDFNDCARCYRAYLPTASQRLHPYAAPLESTRLAGLPTTLIASAHHDLLHIEAERYGAALIEAGVPVEVTRHRDTSHHAIASYPQALADVVDFLQRRLRKATLSLVI